MAIRNFSHKGLRELFEKGRSSKIGQRYRQQAIDLLDILNESTGTKDLVGVGDFHALGGDLKGFYSLHVNGNWTIIFRFEKGDNGDVLDVDFVDYH
jgi:proteic killer suppression protein